MLAKRPNPNKLSEMSAWARGLWIRRVLVREGNSKRDAGLSGVALCLFARGELLTE